MGSPYNPDLSPQGRDDIGKIKGTYGNGGFGNAGVVCSFGVPRYGPHGKKTKRRPSSARSKQFPPALKNDESLRACGNCLTSILLPLLIHLMQTNIS